VPVVDSLAFGDSDLDERGEAVLGRRRGHIYSRNTKPTVEVLESRVRALERAEACTNF
jgi:cystathionine gamma-synthase